MEKLNLWMNIILISKQQSNIKLLPKQKSISIKYFIIFILVVFFIISIIKQKYKNSYNLRAITPIKNHINQANFIKYNTYNISINNVDDFYKSNYFILIPDKFCPNQDLKTYFFKPKYPQLISNFIKFQDKNISLQAVKLYKPTGLTDEINEVREKLLTQLGFKLESKIKSFNLYKVPYKLGSSFINNINKFIINKFQKINRFFNYQEYLSKSLLYLNYKKIKDKYPLDFDYMLETYNSIVLA